MSYYHFRKGKNFYHWRRREPKDIDGWMKWFIRVNYKGQNKSNYVGNQNSYSWRVKK